MDDNEFKLLSDASSKIASSANKYVRLREMLSDTSSAGKEKFRKEFVRYYKLNSAGLTPEWKVTYLELLFALLAVNNCRSSCSQVLSAFFFSSWDRALS